MVEHGDSLGTGVVGCDYLCTLPACTLRHVQPVADGLGNHPLPGLFRLAGIGSGEMDGTARLVRENELKKSSCRRRHGRAGHS
jgi:hypothetical protein